jgi:nickel transport protein
MNIRYVLSGMLFFFALVLPAQAHQLNLFTWSEGDIIHGETHFGRSSKAKNVAITVYCADTEELIVKTHSNDEGRFQFSAPEKSKELLLVADDGQGHRAELVLEAEDLDTPSVLHSLSEAESPFNEQILRRLVAEEVKREVAPVRQALAEQHSREPNFRDILGGLGWIFGLAGLTAWLQSRKSR